MFDAIASNIMRTTLDIDDDVLQAAKERARRERSTAGKVLSALARRALTKLPEQPSVNEPKAIYGLRPIANRGGIVTNEIIAGLREDDSY
jgi:hypothetical protein